MKLMILLGSSRQVRMGDRVALWVRQVLQQDNRFELDFVDIRELDLPFFDEPMSPFSFTSIEDYKNPNGKAWAERVGKAEGYLLITPEYNRGYPAVLKNAIDWVGKEWGKKPVTFVSYSTGMVGGARAVEQLRTVLIELELYSTSRAVHIGRVQDVLDEQGNTSIAALQKSLQGCLDELLLIAKK